MYIFYFRNHTQERHTFLCNRIMAGPRLELAFGPQTCLPFSNCTHRDELLNIISKFSFEDDGRDDNMNCAQSSGSYVLICQSLYNMAFAGTDIPMLGILLAVAVLVILCLSIYIVKLKKLINYQQNIENKNKDKKEDCEETQTLSPK